MFWGMKSQVACLIFLMLLSIGAENGIVGYVLFLLEPIDFIETFNLFWIYVVLNLSQKIRELILQFI